MVRTNRKSRTFLALLLFGTIAAHLSVRQSGPLAWALLTLQFIVYPQLAYLRASRSRNQVKAEKLNFLADPFILGMWAAGLGFPPWISFAMFSTVTFTHSVYYRWKGFVQAIVIMLAGALAGAAITGLRYEPDTGWLATLFSMLTITLYVLQVAEGANTRAVKLNQTRHRLRDSQRALEQKLEEIQALQAQLREQATRDPLTGLYNRRFFSDSLEREMARSLREGEVLSLVMIDVDWFKRVNDSWGHQVGDEVLKMLASLVQSQLRASDVPCRYGGEEFLILLPGMSAQAAQERAEHLRASFASTPVTWDDKQMFATISIGLATTRGACSRAEDLVQCADEALYQAKTAGRNRVVTALLDCEARAG